TDFLDQLGLKTHLSANRATGLVGMIQKIRVIAADAAGH
nr:SufE family protein [Halothiobacillus sp.]